MSAAAVTERDVTIDPEGGGGSMPAFLASPAGWPPGPATVVVQEWWGLTPDIKDVCRRLASEGFAALAPDLFRGRMAQEPDEAHKLLMELDRDQALRDLQGAVGWLSAEGATRIGATGFCMGGGLVWQLACVDERLAAAVPFYGTADLEGRRILAPVIAHYGSADRFEPELLEEIRRRIKSSRAGNELFIYEGAPHAFMNEARPSYRPGAAELAWGRTLTFLRSKLIQQRRTRVRPAALPGVRSPQ